MHGKTVGGGKWQPFEANAMPSRCQKRELVINYQEWAACEIYCEIALETKRYASQLFMEGTYDFSDSACKIDSLLANLLRYDAALRSLETCMIWQALQLKIGPA